LVFELTELDVVPGRDFEASELDVVHEMDNLVFELTELDVVHEMDGLVFGLTELDFVHEMDGLVFELIELDSWYDCNLGHVGREDDEDVVVRVGVDGVVRVGVVHEDGVVRVGVVHEDGVVRVGVDGVVHVGGGDELVQDVGGDE
jgi:hypothetical protein